ncbi:7673_t:CDS:1 [Rhizophagus irregularis]|nr:7673_t:CDS:1 [Rhizophagus irregularis]
MKTLTNISFIGLIISIILIQTTLSEKCVIYSQPIYRFKTQFIDCPMIKKNTNLEKRQNADDMFIVDFHCSIGDSALCSKVKNVFISAGKYITATLNLKTPIKVNAQFLDFCKEQGDCDTQNIILGAARPSRMIPYQDSDGRARLYPQSLYKQLSLPNNHPQMGPDDITAMFNSNMNYWFEGDPTPMSERQVDLLYVVIHELTHGLGFTNSWNDYLNMQILTPIIGQISTGSGPLQAQFVEFVFDKSVVLLPSGQPVTSLADQLNQFQINAEGTEQDFMNSFSKSPQFSIAKDMYNRAENHGTMGFVLSSNIQPNTQLTTDQIQNDIILLETSLNPFQPSSSIGHVDFQTYKNTSDFLMMFTYPPGRTLNDMMSLSGSTKTTGPMGLKLRLLLGILG